MTAGVAALIPLSSEGGTQNFLVPNATFFVELAAFLLLFWLLARFVIPPINRAMIRRQESIRAEFAEAKQAQRDAREAEDKFKAQTADARKQAGKIREEAKEQGDQIVAEAREQAQVEAKRIVDHGHAQLEAERKQALHSLRAEVGTLATELASRIVGESLEDDERANRVVDRFLADLETMETAEAAAQQDGAN
jgi:F-type H+-transporting ATPase subunit b